MAHGTGGANLTARRRRLLAGSTIAITFITTLLVAEVAFHFLPVPTPLGLQPVNQGDPILHFTPNQSFVHSRNWNLKGVNRGRINNFGYVNDVDYDPRARNPLIAVVGDSFVEAVMVPFSDTITGRLQRYYRDRSRVYSFAISGSALSQYVAFAAHAREFFRPDRLIVVIVGNDFDESLLSNKAQPAFHYLAPDRSGQLTLVRKDYQVPGGTPLIRRSALARYLYWNLRAPETIPAIFARREASPERTFVGNTIAAASPQRMKEGATVIDWFLGALPAAAGLPTTHIILVVDGLRESVYSTGRLTADENSYFGRMRTLLMERAGAAGFEVVDMMPRFVARHTRDGSRFEYPWDNHWSGIGHEEAALGVLQTGAAGSFP